MNVKSIGVEFSLLKKAGDLTLPPQPRQDTFFPGQDPGAWTLQRTVWYVRSPIDRERRWGKRVSWRDWGRMGAMRSFSAA